MWLFKVSYAAGNEPFRSFPIFSLSCLSGRSVSSPSDAESLMAAHRSQANRSTAEALMAAPSMLLILSGSPQDWRNGTLPDRIATPNPDHRPSQGGLKTGSEFMGTCGADMVDCVSKAVTSSKFWLRLRGRSMQKRVHTSPDAAARSTGIKCLHRLFPGG